MTARVGTDSAHGGLQALVLENELLRAVVLPELGGKLWQLPDSGPARSSCDTTHNSSPDK